MPRRCPCFWLLFLSLAASFPPASAQSPCATEQDHCCGRSPSKPLGEPPLPSPFSLSAPWEAGKTFIAGGSGNWQCEKKTTHEKSCDVDFNLRAGDDDGEPILAAAAGTIEFAGWLNDWGYNVMISHPADIKTFYAHLKFDPTKNPGIRKDDHVRAGNIIGFLGLTGNSEGTHLHFGVRRGDESINFDYFDDQPVCDTKPITSRNDNIKAEPHVIHLDGTLLRSTNPNSRFGGTERIHYVERGKLRPFTAWVHYQSWLFDRAHLVVSVDDAELSAYEIGEPMSFRPGTLLAFEDPPNVDTIYVVVYSLDGKPLKAGFQTQPEFRDRGYHETNIMRRSSSGLDLDEWKTLLSDELLPKTDLYDRVGGLPSGELPDFTFTFRGLTAPTTALAGGTIQAAVEFHNVDAEDTTSSLAARYYFSTDTTVTTADTPVGEPCVYSSGLLLSTCDQTLQVPSFFAGTNIYLGFIIDYLNQVAESNETNNVAVFGPITVNSDPTPVSPPAAFTLTGTPKCSSTPAPYIDLTWTAASGAESYVVDRNNAVLASLSNTTYPDHDVAPGTTYTYLVTASNVAGETRSNTISATARTDCAPLPPPPPAFPAITWGFDTPGDSEGWTAINVAATEVRDGKYLIDPLSRDPYILSPPLSLDASGYECIQINMSSNLQDGKGRVYFKTTSQPSYANPRSVAFTVTNKPLAGDAGWADYFIPMDDHADWSGTITGIRIDPGDKGDSNTNTDSVGFDYIRILPYGTSCPQ